ncbi:MAG: phosphatase PAP2 family protein [Pirellulales bacterium]
MSLLLLAAACAVVPCDVAVSAWFRRVPQDWLNRFEWFGHGSGLVLIALAIASLEVGGWRRLPRLAVSVLGAGLAANVVKLTVARTRPRTLDLAAASAGETFVGWFPFLAGGSGHQSFPSAHSTVAAALAVALSLAYPRGKWLFGGLAFLACLQRVACQAHFASDALCGAALGWSVAWLVAGAYGRQRAATWARSPAANPPA